MQFLHFSVWYINDQLVLCLSPSLYLLSMRTRAAQGYSAGSASLPPITLNVLKLFCWPHTSHWVLPLVALAADCFLQVAASEVFSSIHCKMEVTFPRTSGSLVPLTVVLQPGKYWIHGRRLEIRVAKYTDHEWRKPLPPARQSQPCSPPPPGRSLYLHHRYPQSRSQRTVGQDLLGRF